MLEYLSGLDHSILLALNFDGGPCLDALMRTASGRSTWIPLYLFLIWMFWRRFGWRGMALALACVALAVVAADQIANIFKYGVQKLRPTHDPRLADMVHTVGGYRGGLYGTVSAHAATCTAIALFTWRIFRRWWTALLLGLWVALVAYSRIYLGVHFPADILFGVVDGALLGTFGWLAFRRLSPKKISTPEI